MEGTMLARDWLLLGAESALGMPKDQIVDVHEGFSLHAERWDELRQNLEKHALASEPADALKRRLRHEMGLGTKSYWLVMLAAAAEIFPEAAAAASVLAEDERVQLVTPLTYARLARAGLGVAFTEALHEALPAGAARSLGLLDAVEVLPGRPLTQQAIRLRPEELSALLGGGHDLAQPRTLSASRVAPSADTVYPSKLALGLAQLLAARGLVVLRCESSRSGRQLALDVASVRKHDAIVVTVGETMPDIAELGRLREEGTVVLDLSLWPNERPLPLRTVVAAAEHLRSLVVLAPRQAATGGLATVSVPPFGRDEAARVWQACIPSADDAAWLASRFRMSVEEARLAIGEARDRAEVEGDPYPRSRDNVARAVLLQGGRRMGRAVTQLASSVRLEDLMVPPALRRKVHDIVSWHRTTARVERDYGLSSTTARGIGLACLFSGQPGTGKTFAAQCIANELGLNLYRIDLSQVVSKYIGETEKALAQVFDEAEAGHGVLLFDEADALFGKRTEVKDAHDRYANVEVGYLLQRMESFSGIAILTTNLKGNIDAAFTRRLRFVLEFPVPDREQRRELWERALPAKHLRRPDVDLGPFIERFRLSGGHIHNIGLAATHLAAANPDGLVGQGELVQATYRELEKAGLARSASEFGPLAVWLPGKEA
jgi:hypothetical protein